MHLVPASAGITKFGPPLFPVEEAFEEIVYRIGAANTAKTITNMAIDPDFVFIIFYSPFPPSTMALLTN